MSHLRIWSVDMGGLCVDMKALSHSTAFLHPIVDVEDEEGSADELAPGPEVHAIVPAPSDLPGDIVVASSGRGLSEASSNIVRQLVQRGQFA